MSTPLRHVVIGAGASILAAHQRAWPAATTAIVGVCDVNAAAAEAQGTALNCPAYTDYQRLLAECAPDVAVILTPHPYHAPLAIASLAAGCHVLVEKPMAIQVAEADAMIAAAEGAGKLLAVNFQQRFRPEIEAARALLAAGELGQIQHVDMALSWTRTAHYYRQGGWRASWRGEGGGVLMNQAPHDLDLICHLLGRPARVVAWTFTTLQAIETEDTVQAMLHWSDGAVGSLHISTAQGPRPYRLEIVGTRGVLQIGQAGVEWSRYETDVAMFIATSEQSFARPDVAPGPVPVSTGTGDHAAVYDNLHRAILHGEPLRADGREGRLSLELANAIILSGQTGRPVDLPLDAAEYAALLTRLQNGTEAW